MVLLNKKIRKEKMAAKQEIERKFLPKFLPVNLRRYHRNSILQGYLLNSRLRKKGRRYYLTKKSGHGLVRIEDETQISRKKFEKLWPKTKGKRIRKIRFYIPYRGHVIELDKYIGNLSTFYLIEVEFKSVFDSKKFTPPKWFGKEVTEDINYTNRNLAIYGIPKSS